MGADCKGPAEQRIQQRERVCSPAGEFTAVGRAPIPAAGMGQHGHRDSTECGAVQLYAQLPHSVLSVVQSNFMRSYRARQESERKMQAIPADVRAKLAGIAEVKQIPSYDIALAERMMDYNSGNG